MREANSVIETAQNNADDIVNEAMVKAQELIREADQYKTEILEIRRELRLKMQEYLKTLEKSDMPEEPKLSERMLDFDINL